MYTVRNEDRQFIDSDMKQLLSEGIIEPSNSPWRAQVVVITCNKNQEQTHTRLEYVLPFN